ncbi:cysteine desulfurase [Candidatus Kaiserbacteria bacterium]|nr:cysteine desulfurase [Candidatus Kaiserbacteria bacterium]
MLFSKRRIYLDYASAPPVLRDAIVAMRDAEQLVGNAGAIHTEGVAAKKSLEDSRARIAIPLGCKARELIITSGLTEANNLAIIGFARKLEQTRRSLSGTHWLVSSIEHDSVLGCFAEIERLGGTVSHVDPDERGIISPDAIGRMLRPETVFVSIGWANNEIGTVQPLGKIARVLKNFSDHHKRHIAFHTDAGQALLYLPTVISSLGVDLLSLGGNKLYGPHGVGALYISNKVELATITFGGKQERGLRAGTESVALAAGFAAAFELVAYERKLETERLKKLRDELAHELAARIPSLIVNGDLKHSLPHMLNVSIPNIQSEYVTLALDHAGFAVSTKSACREGEESRSHVVAALGGEEWRAANTIRISLGRDTRQRDIGSIVSALTRIVRIVGKTP